jgi:superfamily II RNA helicase
MPIVVPRCRAHADNELDGGKMMPKTNIRSKQTEHAARHKVQRFVPRADRTLRLLFNRIGVPDQLPFVADDFQVEAIEAITYSDVLVSAPTGAGKTWIAVEAMRAVLKEGRRAWYASPLKALSNSKYHEFCLEFGSEHVGVITGDRKENTDARILVGTTEILRNQLYDSMNSVLDFKSDIVILDEAHYLGDIDRGVVWEEVMIYLPARVRLLMLSATIPNAEEIAGWLTGIRKHPCAVVRTDNRPVPIQPVYLLPSGELLPIGGLHGVSEKIDSFIAGTPKQKYKRHSITTYYDNILEALRKYNLLPAVFFLKSRMDCNTALHACRTRLLSSERSRRIRDRVAELLSEYPFLEQYPQLQFILQHGLAAHHGGQLPHWKVLVEKLMQDGHLDAIFSTSTVAAGVNFPARTVVLVQSDRFNGKEFVSLSATELHQATGRAGRRGKDKIGFAVIVHGPYQNPHLINELFSKQPEPIVSQITINFSMCLNLLLSHRPEEIRSLLSASFATFQGIQSLRDLEKRQRDLGLKVDEFLHGSLCVTAEEVNVRTIERQEGYKRLQRLTKKKKKLIKAYKKTGLDLDHEPTLNDMTEKISQLNISLRRLPCNNCSNLDLCHRHRSSPLLHLVRDMVWVTSTLSEARNRLWYDFKRHYEFLQLNGFADEQGRLTPDGVWASKLRLDQPLIIAELIRRQALEVLSPELLAGIIAVFVNDKFRDIDIDGTYSWNKRPLMEAYFRMKSVVDHMAENTKKHHFDVPIIQFWPAAALYTWAGGDSWENVIRFTSVDEGDLAMLIYRTADNLRQLASLQDTHPELAGKARQGIQLLLREPVTLPA